MNVCPELANEIAKLPVNEIYLSSPITAVPATPITLMPVNVLAYSSLLLKLSK